MEKTKVLFYPGPPFLFRATTIAHLYEISQSFRTVLLSEEIDAETKKILDNKGLFPKLEKIIGVRQFTGEKKNPLIKNRELYKLAKDVVLKYKPRVVVVENDIYPFERYLLRFSKKIKAVNICFQSCNRSEHLKDEVLLSFLINSYRRLPFFLPLSFRLFIIGLGKHLKYFLYHWILPLMVGEVPFQGKSNCFLWHDIGQRDSDFLIALSERDRNAYIQDGVQPEKIFILSHPLKRKTTKNFFENNLFLKSTQRQKNNQRVLTIILSLINNFSFKKENYTLISQKEILKIRREIIDQIIRTFKDWKIFIKPHPQGNISDVKRIFGIFPEVEIINPLEPVDKYIGISDVVIGLPPQSTVLFTTVLRYPEKPILSLDLEQELGGDYYKNFNGIEYINDKKKFIDILEAIRDNKYQKKYQEKKEEKKSWPREFSDINSLLEYLLEIQKC